MKYFVNKLITPIILGMLVTTSHALTLQDVFNEKSGTEIETSLIYKEKSFFGVSERKIETVIYRASNPKDTLVLWQHGSVTSPNQIKVSHRLLRVADEFNNRGYNFVIWMRKGRGTSEGSADELFSPGECSPNYILETLENTVDQTKQIITQLRERLSFKKVIIIGHSRGGMIASYYATKHPEDVEAIVNIAGGYSLPCDVRNGYFSKTIYEKVAKFPKQQWLYYDNDPFFDQGRMTYINSVAEKNNIPLTVLSGNHARPLIDPQWVQPIINWIEKEKQ